MLGWGGRAERHRKCEAGPGGLYSQPSGPLSEVPGAREVVPYREKERGTERQGTVKQGDRETVKWGQRDRTVKQGDRETGDSQKEGQGDFDLIKNQIMCNHKTIS